MEALSETTVLFTLALTLSMIVERVLEIVKCTLDLLDSRFDWYRFWTWRANLLAFLVAASLLVGMIIAQAGFLILLPAAVMIMTFVLGERFTHLPNVHLQEFSDALRHGEILLMIDVPRERVGEVEYRVHTRHPEAVAGGASWNTPALGT